MTRADWAACVMAAAARWSCEPDGDWISTDDALLLPVRPIAGGRSPIGCPPPGLPEDVWGNEKWGTAPVRLMLKLVDPEGDETGAADWLRAAAPAPAVRLLAADGPVMLMERLLPVGPTLADMALGGADDAALTVLVEVTLALQRATATVELPWLIPLDRRVAFVGHLLDEGRVPPALRTVFGWARGFLAEMVADRTGWRPLHGDIHHGNVLHDRSRGWIAIDPKGLLGPAPYDLANCLLNPAPHAALVHDRVRMARQAGIIAAQLGCTSTEMLRWAALQGLLGAAWSIGDDELPYWLAGARLAAGLAGLRLPD